MHDGTYLSLRTPHKEGVKNVPYQWNQLAMDPTMQQQEDEDICIGYKRFAEANKAATEVCLPQVP